MTLLKKTLLIVTLFLNFLGLSQTTSLKIDKIKSVYKTININLDSYDTTMIQIWDESTEGGQAVAYYDSLELQLIQIVLLGEMGKSVLEFYFSNDSLIFAFDQTQEYNRPIYWDEKTAKENGDNEAFDYNKTKFIEDRYYFHQETLIKWINPKKESVDLTLGTNSIAGNGLLAHCYQMKEKLKK